MTKDEALKLALEALENFKEAFVKIQDLGMYYGASSKDVRIGEVLIQDRAIAAIEEALAQPEQEPVAYIHVEQRRLQWAKPMSWNTPTTVNLPKIPLYTTPPLPEERNFCPRCGKRTADLTTIHTCTPPRENA
jgi:hypothetical protein